MKKYLFGALLALIAVTASMTMVSAQTPSIVISQLSPNTCVVDSGEFILTVDGTGFISSSTVVFGHISMSTTFVSATELTAEIPAASIASIGVYPVSVTNGEGNGHSAPVAFTVTPNKAAEPSIGSLSPTTCVAGSGAFTLTVDGTNFVSGSTVYFGGAAVSTTYTSATELSAAIPADSVQYAGKFQVVVVNGADNGGHSAPVAFTVTPDTGTLPSMTGITPDTCAAGSASFIVTIDGANFLNTSVVKFNGFSLATTFVSSTELTATVDPSLVAKPGKFPVWVTNGDLQGHSQPIPFTVEPQAAANAPTITSLSPDSCIAGSGDFTLTVAGTNFVTGSTVHFGDTALVTTYVSSSELTAAVPGQLVDNPGRVPVVVANGPADGGHSTSVAFKVETPSSDIPTITGISPNTVPAGSGALTLTVAGAGFDASTIISLATIPLATTYVSTSEVTASVPALLVLHPGDYRVWAANGSTSAHSEPVIFTVTKPANPPAITSLTPDTCVAGSSSFTLTVDGTGFVSTATVYFGDVALATTFVSATEVTATVPATSVADAHRLAVVVANGDGQGHSAPVVFSVTPNTGARPHIGGIAPTSCVAGSAGFTLTVNGSNFDASSVVSLGGTALSTTLVSANQVTAVVPAQLVATAGSFKVVVANNGADSNKSVFVVIPTQMARVVYMIGPAGGTDNDGINTMFTFTPQTAPDFTQPVSLELQNPATNTTAAVQVYQIANLTLTAQSETIDGGQVTVYQYEDPSLLLTVTPLADGQYCLTAEATSVDLSTIDTTQPVAITLTIGSQSFNIQVTPKVHAHS